MVIRYSTAIVRSKVVHCRGNPYYACPDFGPGRNLVESIIICPKKLICPYIVILYIDNVTVHSKLKDVGKCLGHLCKNDLSSRPMIEEKIGSARKDFFKFGSISAFYGDLSPNSSSSVFECCVISVLTYGVE